MTLSAETLSTPSEGVQFDPDMLQIQLTIEERMEVEEGASDQQEQTGEGATGRKRKEEKRRQGGPK